MVTTLILQLVLAALLAAQGAVGGPGDSQAIRGTANYADPSHGSAYLAMRLPRGTRVTISGPGGSWHATVNDYGPAKRTGDIADIALVHFAHVCGWSVAKARRMGECTVTVSWGDEIELPATDTLETP